MQNKKGDENMSNKEKLAERWEQGRISEAMLRVYVRKGILSKASKRSAGRRAERRTEDVDL